MKPEDISKKVIEQAFEVSDRALRDAISPAYARSVTDALNVVTKQQAIDFDMRRFAITIAARSQIAEEVEEKPAIEDKSRRASKDKSD